MSEQDKKDKSNPFNPEALRLSNDFGSVAGVKKLITTVPVRKPNKQDWFRVHPDESYRMNLGVIELKDDQEVYAVAPGLHSELADQMEPVTLYTCVQRQGTIFLWKVRLPSTDGKSHSAWDSAHGAAQRAMRKWTQMSWNASLGAYDVFEAAGIPDDPKWPDEPFERLLETAFRGKLIDSLEHPVVRRLRGEN